MSDLRYREENSNSVLGEIFARQGGIGLNGYLKN